MFFQGGGRIGVARNLPRQARYVSISYHALSLPALDSNYDLRTHAIL
jgi:hypothetical protein